MTNERPDEKGETTEDLAAEAKAENPDETTRRETLELDLMEQHRSEEGASVTITDDAESTES